MVVFVPCDDDDNDDSADEDDNDDDGGDDNDDGDDNDYNHDGDDDDKEDDADDEYNDDNNDDDDNDNDDALLSCWSDLCVLWWPLRLCWWMFPFLTGLCVLDGVRAQVHAILPGFHGWGCLMVDYSSLEKRSKLSTPSTVKHTHLLGFSRLWGSTDRDTVVLNLVISPELGVAYFASTLWQSYDIHKIQATQKEDLLERRYFTGSMH